MEREEKIQYLKQKSRYTYDDLVMIMELLRSPGGCPWDMEQNHKSIRNDFIEETYEAIEAIDTDNPELLREELGDVLLQVVFHSRIEEEAERFDIYDVTNDICAKLIYRHPHVFGDVIVKDSGEVLENWSKLKGQEKTERVTVTDKLNAVPKMYPALMRAQKVGKRAKCFDFDNAEQVIDKIKEEISEVEEAVTKGNQDSIQEEIGDLLLTITSLARKTGVNAEESLYHATDKFIDRFSVVEGEVISRGLDIYKLPMSELDKIWDEIKHKDSRKEN